MTSFIKVELDVIGKQIAQGPSDLAKILNEASVKTLHALRKSGFTSLK
jgi:hypothetical protein